MDACCLACALLKKPKVLILDDSTSEVGTKTDAAIQKSLAEFIPDTTKIIIAQRISSVQHADQIIVMDDGKVVLDDTPSEVFSHVEELKRLGLDVPQVTELAYRLRKAGCPVDAHMITESECVAVLAELLQSKTGGAVWQS